MSSFHRTTWIAVAMMLSGSPGWAEGGSLGGFFGDVELLPAHLNQQGWVWHPSVTEDQLELYFSRSLTGESFEICVARRASADDEWGPVEPLTQLGRGGGPFVMPDGLTLYFNSGKDIFRTTRENRDASFRFLEPLTEINTTKGEWYPSVTRDGRELYFTRWREDHEDLYVAWRSDADGPFEGQRLLDEIASPDRAGSAGISPDGLTLFWSDMGNYWGNPSRPGCESYGNIWYATRKERWARDGLGNEVSARFGPPECLGPPISGPANDDAPRVSWDWNGPGSKLYFCRYGPGQFPLSQLWQATWNPDCNGDGKDDAEQIAAGELTDADGDGVPDECGAVTRRFIRGNANSDDTMDLSDAVFVLNFLFLGETAPSCKDAADADDNGSLEITDAVYLLNFLFLGGPAPAEPFPECGPDPMPDDALTCESFPGCEEP